MRRFFYLKNRGMTMIEILIVASLIGIVSISIYGALSVGLKVWQRSRSSVIEQDVAIFFDKLTKDLHNSLYFSPLPAQGDGQRFAFPSIVRIAPANNEDAEPIEQIGLIEYEYNPIENQVYRREASYGKALNNAFSKSQIVLSKVERIDFRYIYVSDGQQIDSEYLLETLPASVEVVVSFEDAYGWHDMKKFIDLPLSL